MISYIARSVLVLLVAIFIQGCVSSGERHINNILIGKHVKFLKEDVLFTGKDSPGLHVEAGDIFKVIDVFSRISDGETILRLKSSKTDETGNRTLEIIQKHHEIIYGN